MRSRAHFLVDALERVEALQRAQLQQPCEGRPEVTAKLVLRPLFRGGVEAELHEARVARRLRQSHADLADARSLQRLCLAREEALAVLQDLLQLHVRVVEQRPVRDAWEGVLPGNNVEEVHWNSRRAALPLHKRGQQLIVQLEALHVGRESQETMPVVLLPGTHWEELSPSRRLPKDFHVDQPAGGGEPGKVGMHSSLLHPAQQPRCGARASWATSTKSDKQRNARLIRTSESEARPYYLTSTLNIPYINLLKAPLKGARHFTEVPQASGSTRLDLGVRIAEGLHQQLHLQASVDSSREVLSPATLENLEKAATRG